MATSLSRVRNNYRVDQPAPRHLHQDIFNNRLEFRFILCLEFGKTGGTQLHCFWRGIAIKKEEGIDIYYSCMAFDMVGKQSLNPVLYGV